MVQGRMVGDSFVSGDRYGFTFAYQEKSTVCMGENCLLAGYLRLPSRYGWEPGVKRMQFPEI